LSAARSGAEKAIQEGLPSCILVKIDSQQSSASTFLPAASNTYSVIRQNLHDVDPTLKVLNECRLLPRENVCIALWWSKTICSGHLISW